MIHSKGREIQDYTRTSMTNKFRTVMQITVLVYLQSLCLVHQQGNNKAKAQGSKLKPRIKVLHQVESSKLVQRDSVKSKDSLN